jgi:hypothetical protein
VLESTEVKGIAKYDIKVIIQRSCLRAFHVNCALHSGMKMEVREEKNRTTGNVTMHRFVFCHLHSETGYYFLLYSIENKCLYIFSEISNQAEWNRSVAEKMAKAKRMANISTREKHEISIPVVPQEK